MTPETVNFNRLQDVVARTWDASAMPALLDYIAIPCQSPAFDPHWAANGHLDRALHLMHRWSQEALRHIPGVTLEAVRLPGRTPLLLIDVPGTSDAAVFVYGHLDKQPPMSGWREGHSAWRPVLEGERLYGRGGADDGYAVFSAVTAILALHEQEAPRARCIILIEASEESGSPDLSAYIEHMAPRLPSPAVVVALDAGCGDYERLWLTTSLRGQVAGTLSVQVLTEGAHSGDASGVAASSFRIARQLLSRIEDPATGRVIVPPLHAPIPPERRDQAERAATALGAGVYEGLPFHPGTLPVEEDVTELLLNRTWRPQMTITGIDGLPAVADAAAVLHPISRLKISVRLPPITDAREAGLRVKALLEENPPYRSRVSFELEQLSQGWHAPAEAPWLKHTLEEASRRAFGQPCAYMGGGGGIPFLAMLGARFPQTQFVVTGVLGPRSNAHGPNEFLHVPTARRVTAAIAQLIHDAAQH